MYNWWLCGWTFTEEKCEGPSACHIQSRRKKAKNEKNKIKTEHLTWRRIDGGTHVSKRDLDSFTGVGRRRCTCGAMSVSDFDVGYGKNDQGDG